MDVLNRGSISKLFRVLLAALLVAFVGTTSLKSLATSPSQADHIGTQHLDQDELLTSPTVLENLSMEQEKLSAFEGNSKVCNSRKLQYKDTDELSPWLVT